MALNEFVESINGGLNKKYSGTSTPPNSGSGVTFYQGDWYVRTDVTAGAPVLYFYTGSAWKAQGNIAG